MFTTSSKTKAIIKQLYKKNIIKRGDFTLKSGLKSNIYINLRQIIAYPKLLSSVSQSIYDRVYNSYSICTEKTHNITEENSINIELNFDLVFGCAYSGIPIATTFSTKYNIPMIFKRKEAKEYGTKQLIEGEFKPGQRVLLIDDVLTSGSSLKENIDELEKAGLIIAAICVFVDRRKRNEDGRVAEKTELLEDKSYNVMTVTTLDEVLKITNRFRREEYERMQDKVFVALDGLEREDLNNVLADLSGKEGIAFKLNDAYTKYGPEVVQYIHARGFNVFMDLKFFDIKNTVVNYAKTMINMGVYMFNIHCMVGPDSLKAVRQAVDELCAETGKRKPLIMGMTILSSMDEQDLCEIFEWGKGSVDYMVLKLAQMAQECGLDGVVCAPSEIKMVKEYCGEDFLTISAGVRPEWATSDEQKRISKPGDVIRREGDYMVIGRPIVQAKRYGYSVGEAVDKIFEEIDAAYEEIDMK